MWKLSLIVVSLCALPAYAQDAKVVRRLESINRMAMEDYELGDYGPAKKSLSDALAKEKEAQLESQPICALTHLNLGLVYAALASNDEAMKEFRTALDIDVAAKLPEKYAKPDAQKLFDEAKKPPPPPPPPVPETIVGLVHVPVDSGDEGTPIVVEIKVGADVRAKKVTLHYQPKGAPAYVTVDMAAAAGLSFVGEIPAEATAVETINYFIDARNAKDKVAAARGNAASPFVIAVKRRPKEEAPDHEVDEENPLAK